MNYRKMSSLAVIALFAISSAYAEDKPKDKMDLKAHTEMHEKMAKAHSDAAECLKSGKPLDECRKKFKEACKDSGDKMCGMGKGMGMGKGKGYKHGQDD